MEVPVDLSMDTTEQLEALDVRIQVVQKITAESLLFSLIEMEAQPSQRI
jgi:hypothetical protein